MTVIIYPDKLYLHTVAIGPYGITMAPRFFGLLFVVIDIYIYICVCVYVYIYIYIKYRLVITGCDHGNPCHTIDIMEPHGTTPHHPTRTRLVPCPPSRAASLAAPSVWISFRASKPGSRPDIWPSFHWQN